MYLHTVSVWVVNGFHFTVGVKLSWYKMVTSLKKITLPPVLYLDGG